MLEELRKGGAVAVRDRELGGYAQHRVFALRAPILGKFTAQEIALVDELISGFWNMTATEISKLSHGFVGWHNTPTGKTIPYALALLGSREPTPEERRYGAMLEDLARERLAP